MNCVHCGHRFARGAPGKLKVRVPILIFKADGTASTSCPKCKGESPLPISLDGDLVKAMAPEAAPRPKLVLRRHLTGTKAVLD